MVFVKEPIAQDKDRLNTLDFVFINLYIKCGVTPISILGINAIIGFINKKETGLGKFITLNMLNNPNKRPVNPPTTGPAIREPIIARICIMVVFIGGIGIKPNPVAPSTIVIANKSPTVVICLVFNLDLV